ncbi:MAG: hypothetical protein ACTSUE_22840 [Promethearchaeota archaeon]
MKTYSLREIKYIPKKDRHKRKYKLKFGIPDSSGNEYKDTLHLPTEYQRILETYRNSNSNSNMPVAVKTKGLRKLLKCLCCKIPDTIHRGFERMPYGFQCLDVDYDEETSFGYYIWSRAFFGNVYSPNAVDAKYSLGFKIFGFWWTLIWLIADAATPKEDLDRDGEPGVQADGINVGWLGEAPHPIIVATLGYFLGCILLFFKIKTIEERGPIPKSVFAIWLLHDLALTGSVLMVLFYLTFLNAEEEHNSVTLLSYIMICLVMCIDAWIGCMYIMPMHVLVLLLYGLVYTIFTYIFYTEQPHEAAIKYIYKAMNWDDVPGTIGNVILMNIVIVFVYTCVALVFNYKNRQLYKIKQFRILFQTEVVDDNEMARIPSTDPDEDYDPNGELQDVPLA